MSYLPHSDVTRHWGTKNWVVTALLISAVTIASSIVASTVVHLVGGDTSAPASTSAATSDDHKLRDTLFGYDGDRHLALDGVALGAPLDDAMPACEGDPQKSTILCHTPLTRSYKTSPELTADVYGFAPKNDDNGQPMVTAMKITTNVDSTVIKSVEAVVEKRSSFNTFLTMSQAFGKPDLESSYAASWDLSGNRSILMSDTFIMLTQH